jgi:hypothetical protein
VTGDVVISTVVVWPERMHRRARSAMATVCVEPDPGELASHFFLLASA